MALFLGGYTLRLPLVPVLVVAPVLALLLALGTWQLTRADEKEAILAVYRERSQAPAAPLPTQWADSEQLRFRHVELTASFVPHRQFLLDNQIRDGRVGFQVLTPARVAGRDELVLVDRGWIPQQGGRDALPDLDVSAEPRRISGVIYVPFGQGLRLGGMDEGQLAWPRLIQYVDFEQLEKRLMQSIAPFTVRLDPTYPDGYLREWPVIAVSPERHLAYAIQWFGLAVVLVVGFIAVNLKRDARDD
jgi:surfeit locus 1 family protein